MNELNVARKHDTSTVPLDATRVSEAISNTYMLVTTNIRCWEACKLDKRRSAALVADAGAVEGAARVHKSLFAGADSQLKAVRKAFSRVRTRVNEHSFPYCADEVGNKQGPKAMPTRLVPQERAAIDKLIKKAEIEKGKFIMFYDDYRQKAIQSLGSLGDANDYPEVREVADKFSVSVHFRRIAPTDYTGMVPSDLAVELGNDAAAEQIDSFKTSIADLQSKLRTEIEGLSAVMSKAVRGERTKIFDSRFAKIRYLAQSLSAANLLDDSRLDDVVTKVAALGRYDADIVRDSATLQADLASKSEALLLDSDFNNVFDCLEGI